MTLPGPTGWPVADLPVTDLSAALAERAGATPDRTALVDADGDARLTYAEFDRRASERASSLDADLPGSSGRVAVALGTGVDFATTVFAAWRAGRPVVALNLALDEATLADQAARADAAAVVCATGTADLARSVAPDDAPVLSVDDDWTAGDGVADRGPPDGEHLVLFTSGTTGRPKGVRLSGANLAASANASADRLGVEPGDRWLAPLPMYHMGGFAPLVRSTLYGTTTVLQGEFDPDGTARVIDERAVTCVSLVPTALTRLLDAGWTPPDRLRFVLLGGGPAPESLIERCERLNVPVCPTYGATETASQVATALPVTAFAHPGTVGRPLAGTTVAVVGEDGAPVDAGSTGELVVDGPTVSPGYLDEEATAAAVGEDGLHTGDLGCRDGAGRLWIEGRVDDVIVTGGENVRPSAVAAAIRTLPGVDDAAVVGVPDPEWGERVAALVVASDPSVDADTVRARCRGRVADYAVPKSVALVDALPRTESGTVDRERARELATS